MGLHLLSLRFRCQKHLIQVCIFGVACLPQIIQVGLCEFLIFAKQVFREWDVFNFTASVYALNGSRNIRKTSGFASTCVEYSAGFSLEKMQKDFPALKKSEK